MLAAELTASRAAFAICSVGDSVGNANTAVVSLQNLTRDSHVYIAPRFTRSSRNNAQVLPLPTAQNAASQAGKSSLSSGGPVTDTTFVPMAAPPTERAAFGSREFDPGVGFHLPKSSLARFIAAAPSTLPVIASTHREGVRSFLRSCENWSAFMGAMFAGPIPKLFSKSRTACTQGSSEV